jgi:two-component system KDP operon response regulator KdpE
VEAATGERALQVAATENPDLILLDLGLPNMGGIDVIHGVRGWSPVPIIVLTVRDDERSKVAALDAGADDYVTKPFAINELLARVRVAAPDTSRPRHHHTDAPPDLAGPRERNGNDVHLTTEGMVNTCAPPERLVMPPAHHSGWGRTEPDANLLLVHLTHIRRKLEPDPSRPRYFMTEPGMGYRFEP